MKVCKNCGKEIATKDGENFCPQCDEAEGVGDREILAQRRQLRRERNQVMKDLGLVKVRGALGGVYWE